MDNTERTLFDFMDYKAYILWREEIATTRGLRKDLASVMNCQAPYVSQVLNGDSHLSLEQAEKANALLGHSKQEAQFFLLLVQFARAGTESLRDHFREQLKDMLNKRQSLKNRFENTEGLSLENQMTYYSQATYALVHIALTIEKMQTPSALTKHLGLPENQLNEVLEFLTLTGLVEKHGTRYKVGHGRIHLGHDSKLVLSHHRNWRLAAIENLPQSQAEDLHYSSVVSIGAKDYEKIRESLARAIDRTKKAIRESPEEELAVFNLDFFRYK